MGDGMDQKASDFAMADVDAHTRPDPLVGSVVNGKFHVRSAIARGGMGRIYFATQVPLERPVALKVVQADGDREHESQFLKRFLQEASILAKLQHPNVVTLFDYGKIEGSAVERYFIAMEYLAGETLAHRLAARAPIPAADALVLFRQIARGLREAHVRGIVHRDLKPSNIILVPEGDGGELVKLVDFGIGKVLERGAGSDDLTQDGMMVGTPKYMAPEQFEGIASPASDLYSLGTILFQALTNRLPFQGNSLAEFMVAKFAHPVPRLRDVNPQTDASERLEALVMRLLARKPEERPTLEEIFGQLAACEEETFGTSAGRRMATGGYMALLAQTGSVTPPPMAPSTGSFPMAPPSPSGSGPHLPVGSQHGALRVPLTVVASTPPLAAASASGVTPHTPRPTATTPAPAAPSAGGRAGLAVALVAVVLLLAGGGIWMARSGSQANAGTGEEPEAQPTPSATANASANANATGQATPTAFVLSIDSTPSGASVYEGESLVGTTPLQLRVERTSVTRAPRTFSVKKEGFTTTDIVQGPSDSDVKSVVTLAAEAAGKPTRTPGGGSGRPSPGGKPPSNTTPPSSSTGSTGSTDIRLTR